MTEPVYLHWIDWAIILSYIAFSLGVGIYFSKKAASNTEEYFLSGRSLPWGIGGTSMVATTFAADTPLAITEFVRGPVSGKTGSGGIYSWDHCLEFFFFQDYGDGQKY